jgi:hypothetical protein
LNTCFKKIHGIYEQEDFQAVLRGTGETETAQEYNQDWLELDEGDPGFQLLTEEEIAAVIFFYLFSSALPILLNFPFICFVSFFLSFTAIFCFINQNYCLIWTTSPYN